MVLILEWSLFSICPYFQRFEVNLILGRQSTKVRYVYHRVEKGGASMIDMDGPEDIVESEIVVEAQGNQEDYNVILGKGQRRIIRGFK